MKKLCVECGNILVSPRTKYCSTECKQKYNYKNITCKIEKNCEVCGNTYKICNKNQKFCSKECRKKDHIIHPELYKHSEETKKILSLKLSQNNHGGRCKWFTVGTQRLQGTQERDLAIKFDELNIKYEKVRKYLFQYVLGDKVTYYTPDFYLEEFDIYLELKGYWQGNDRQKMKTIFDQYPEYINKVLVIEKNNYNRLLTSVNEDVIKIIEEIKIFQNTDKFLEDIIILKKECEIKEKVYYTCKLCKIKFQRKESDIKRKKSIFCSKKCSDKFIEKVDQNNIDLIKMLVDNKNNFCAVARILKVSDNTVRKRFKKINAIVA